MPRDRPPPPFLTPIPMAADREIDLKAAELAGCVPNLDADERHDLARKLAYRCRNYPRRGKE